MHMKNRHRIQNILRVEVSKVESSTNGKAKIPIYEGMFS